MKCNIGLLLLAVLHFGVSAAAKFSYEKGNCQYTILGAVQDMLRSEVRAFINPRLRRSNYKHIQYDLYTVRNPYKRQILKLGDVEGLKSSYFNPKWPVRFSIHGWNGKSESCSNAAVKDAYLERGNFNVIIVDWSQYSSDISYARVSKQLAAIAASFVEFLKFLKRTTDVSYEQMYMIGHSAGAHIAGLAGKLIKPQRFAAIFALDPAGLSQLGLSAPHRLAVGDAIYIESIHTDISVLGNPSTQLSDATFFVNWGQGQPQCPNATAAEFEFACDHFSALYYFAESIRNPKRFGALQCKNVTPATTHSAAFVNVRQRNFENFNCACAANEADDSSRNNNNNKNENNDDNNKNYKHNDSTNNDSDDSSGSSSSAVVDICAANVFMGGEPAAAKSGVFYLSTHNRPPFGYGSMVHMRAPLKPNFLRSFLSQNVFNKIYFGL